MAGLVSASTAAVGAMASGKGEALFSIIARSEFDLVGLVPTRDIAKLQINQSARIKVIGAGDVDGRVRRLSTTVEPNSQLAQVFIAVTTEPPAVGEFIRAGADQDRPELRRLGAADRDPLWQCRHRGAGGEARSASRRGGSKPG